jgi:uncharacterized protein (UPF0371 family)
MAINWIRMRKGQTKSKSKSPFISISNGTHPSLYFNSRTMSEYLNHNKHIKLGVNNLKKKLYIKQSTVNDIHAIKINKSKRSNGGTITKGSLVSKIAVVAGIKKNDIQRYKLQKESNTLFYVDFTRPMDNIEGGIINDWE